MQALDLQTSPNPFKKEEGTPQKPGLPSRRPSKGKDNEPILRVALGQIPYVSKDEDVDDGGSLFGLCGLLTLSSSY